MKYVNKTLMPDEEVEYMGKIHWFIYLPGIIMFVAAFLVLFAFTDAPLVITVGITLLVFSFISMLKAFIKRTTTELVVTSKRVIAKFGLIKRETVELNHSKVESFNVDQSVLGRIFGFGTLIINGTGGNQTPIPEIDSPLDFRRSAMEVIDASQ